ncbi:hypothetical protein DH2020_038562 [Rehmannia glutinosa]|uniref:WAT1-related protein n=1 Tax=Rehmannia glutinosa TaxID=99300 RepID=A0ABR0UY69_REHGL
MAQEKIISERMKLLISLFILQFCFAGFHIVSRVALNIGERQTTTHILFVGSVFPSSTSGNYCKPGFYILGLYYASPTFASAMQNSVPAITFIMASALRLEQVSLTRIDGVAKILGTVASVGGAMIITLYKGPPILNQTSETEGSNSVLVSSNKVQNWTWGCIFLLGHCLSWAGWMVLQAPIVKKYPAKLSLTSFTFSWINPISNYSSFRREGPKALANQVGGRDLYNLIRCLVISLQTWCIQKGGPVFVASFQPVQTVLVAGMAFVILGDQLYSGGVIGAVLIMIGLYLVLWGKTAETRYQSKDTEETLTKHLLEGNNNDQENPDRNDVP